MATASSDTPPRTPRARADIETDLAALRADVAALAESVRSYGQARAQEMTGAAGEAAQDLCRQVDALEKELETTVRDHPVQALLAAFGLGFVLSLLLRR